jgi:hypothetical protein
MNELPMVFIIILAHVKFVVMAIHMIFSLLPCGEICHQKNINLNFDFSLVIII